MTWADAILFAGRGLLRRRSRAVLTLMAVALAAALLTALMMIAETGRTRVLDQLSRGGPLAGIRVDKPVGDAELQQVRGLPHVAAVVPIAITRLLVATDGGGVTAGGKAAPGAAPAAPALRSGTAVGEIGVLKAIEARDRDVRRIFLLEAAALGFGGGLSGTLLGWAIARGVGALVNDYLSAQGLAGVRVALPVTVLTAGILGSTVLALLAGTVPAVRAARLPARDAMGEA